MRYLILSDIHSNLEAFEACIQRAKQASYDAVLCCGDIVGYGPNPVEAIKFRMDQLGMTRKDLEAMLGGRGRPG